MWPLIKRDLDQMVTTTLRSSAISHVIFIIIAVVLMWLLGTNKTGLFETRSINLFILLIGMMMAGQIYSQFNLEEDASDRQLTFLQLLPIRTRHIVHSKFLANVIVAYAAFVWASLLISINLWINSTWSIDGWLPAVAFVAMLLVLMSSSLLWYFFIGNKRGFIIMYVFVIGWIATLFIVLGPVKDSVPISFGVLCILLLCCAIMIYLISWLLSVYRVQKKGIPTEVESLLMDKQYEYIEDLKRRYQARKEREK